MNHSDFVHLHNHSDYSLLDGASSIPRMVERAAELGMPALALTDHGAMFGAVEFYQAARKAGIKPIIGMEAYVTRGRRQDRTRDTAHHLVLLCKDERGFKNLMRLSSLAFLEGFYYKPRLDHEILASHAEGLIALSACPKGEVATALVEDREEEAAHTALKYREMFGAENYFLEVQNHGLDIETKIRERMRSLSTRTGIPLVVTNDCHYLRHEDAEPHDVLLCIQTGKTVEDKQRLRYMTDQVYFKSADEMRLAFPDFPHALTNTLAIAERCDLQLQFGRPLLPEFPLPVGVSPEDHLKEITWAELRTRFPEITDSIRQRCEYELEVICRMGFASYFLIVRDFIAFARQRGIGVGPGRGSVAGSLVAYALRITDIDPLEHGLIFERFLNPERVSMPDIDIDFDDLRRGEVIDYVKRKYGEHNVTQIITFGTLGAKGALRDVGRALGIAYAEVDRVARMVPDGLGMTLERALELSPDLKSLPQKGPQFARLLQAARALEGLARHASTHAAGVLITPGPLLDYVPLYRQKDESITTQWDMKSIEKAGLLKMDFLGLRTLSVLQESERLVAASKGIALDLARLPMDDGTAYRIFQAAETVAIFQFESAGMRDYLKRLKPTVFGDLVAMNALYRPGPMENIPYFIDCKHGKHVARYDHSDLEPILKATYGVFVYQEQVMEAAHKLAGFSMAEADELRRAMGKKRPEEMEAKRAAFIQGCAHRKIPTGKAEKIFQTMEKFAGYGFNRCLIGDTELLEAETGERTSIQSLFADRRHFSVHSLGPDWKLHSRRITDVVWNGQKPVFELRTAQGKRITATSNHPFLTMDGWRNLEDLEPSDLIAAPRSLPISGSHSLGSERQRTLSGRHVENIQSGLMSKDTTALAGSELEEKPSSDIFWDRVVSIEPRGVQDTYDLTVEPDHNFVANGIVVHNSHSAAYALLAYQCAYLKAHHPAEFMAATLSSEMSDGARVAALIEECRRMKLEILPPDVNCSEWKFTLEEGRIRFGLGAIRNVGQSVVEALVRARSEGGAFADLFDLARRLDARTLNRRVVESLVAAGACDALGDRAVLFAASGRLLEQAASLHREIQSGQSSLFGDAAEGGVAVVAPPLPVVESWSQRDRSAREKEMLGFYFSEHPLVPLRDQIAAVATHSIIDVAGLEDGIEIRIVGLVGELRVIATRAGKQMAFVTLEDLSGRIECTVFPDTFETARAILVPEGLVVAAGRVEQDDRGTKILLSEVRGWEEARRAFRPALHLEVRAEELSVAWIEGVDEILSRHPGESAVYLHIVMPDRSRQASRSRRYRVAEGGGVLSDLERRFPDLRVRWGKAVGA